MTTTMTCRGRRWLLALALVATLLLAAVACGGDGDGDDDDDDAGGNGSDNSGSSESGAWTGTLETGVDVALELWIDPADPDLAEVEAYRANAGAPPVLYGRVTATNNTGETDNGRFVTLTGEDGDLFNEERIEVNFLCSHFNMWWRDSAQTAEVLAEYEDLLARRCDGNYLGGPTVAPGETVVYYVALEAEAEPAFARVFMGVFTELDR